ncbi:Nif3-like dinuclear metal center hexameric protein [Clostridium aminobutyricum]|uniref:GTP cyclohydrolase 1 type 2 homolog n=1 Tax=Clostridium aminobutyricum TaxID=33953 RepID=A0A939D796_CLOAM|nr:Nif3-like dinuclear metal center hexameric protein [Clostridium aminobutyricum]MBN7772410.1 Nif3-like dinuclear metal center hexameric protein [Clostridium aminobutyricum]
MSISKIQLLEAIEKIAPIHLAESWDNCGIQIDLGKIKIEKILITLEITTDVIREAKEVGADFILTHHPLIFAPLKSINHNNITGKFIVSLIQSGISVISAHTNFDKADDGNNDYLASLMNLENIKCFDEGEDKYIGVYGDLKKECTLLDVCKILEKGLLLSSNEIRAVGPMDKKLSTIGVCTGAGADMLEIAILKNCDLLITGDVKYHDAMKAKELGICVIDAGHYGTEKIFVENMSEQLRKIFHEEVEIIESKVNVNPFDFL